jgi:hypothetical protein
MSLGLQRSCAPRGLVMARNGSSGVGRKHQGSLRVITPPATCSLRSVHRRGQARCASCVPGALRGASRRSSRYSAPPSPLSCCCCWTTGRDGSAAPDRIGMPPASANRLHTRAISIRAERASSVSMLRATAKHSAARRRYLSRLLTQLYAPAPSYPWNQKERVARKKVPPKWWWAQPSRGSRDEVEGPRAARRAERVR